LDNTDIKKGGNKPKRIGSVSTRFAEVIIDDPTSSVIGGCNKFTKVMKDS